MIYCLGLTLATAASTPGLAGRPRHEVPPKFRMNVENCERTADGAIRVVTTGAVFLIHPHQDRIVAYQRIERSRPLATIQFPGRTLRELREIARTPRRIDFAAGPLSQFSIHGDSVLVITVKRSLALRITTAFRPEYAANQPGASLLLDDGGGLSVLFWSPAPSRAVLRRTPHEAELRNTITPNTTFLFGVCPPRPYDWKQHRQERIVHFFPERTNTGASPRPYPTEQELQEWRSLGNVLVLHLEIWKGFGIANIAPADPEAFRRTIRAAHALGYLVLPYSSCYYYKPARIMGPEKYWTPRRWRPNAVGLYLEEARRLLERYDVDGLYWDGYFSDPIKAWRCAQKTRELLGERRLYVHCTHTPLLRPGVYCPFADAYCDYILRGEGMHRDRQVNPIYLRYQVSGRAISNAIGTLCYDTCRIDSELIRWTLHAGARIPYWPGTQVHNGRRYFLTPAEDRLYRKQYLPNLLRTTTPDRREAQKTAGRSERNAWKNKEKRRNQEKLEALAHYLQTARKRPHDPNNLAAFRRPTCSDYCRRWPGFHGLGYLPVYATDGNPDTFWAADYPPQWLEIDLDAIRTIRRIRLLTYWKTPRFYRYRIAVSTDRVHWRTVVEKNDHSPATASGKTWRFPAVRARYVRVTMLQDSANPGLHIAELEVFRRLK